MDRATIDVYECEGADYAIRRGVQQPERATAFAAAVRADGRRLDLGCGPGHYLPLLGRPVLAVDAAGAMVAAAAEAEPEVPAVQADLLDLPFDHGAFAGVWASKAHQHVAAADLPAALAEAHRVLEVGGRLELTMFATSDGGPTTETVTDPASGDDLPGRLFSFWQPDHLATVLRAAGFHIDRSEVVPSPQSADPSGGAVASNRVAEPRTRPAGSDRASATGRASAERSSKSDNGAAGSLRVRRSAAAPGPGARGGVTTPALRIEIVATALRALPDHVGPGMRLLCCGLNPSLHAAAAGIGYVTGSNRFWRALAAAGLSTRDRDPRHLLRHDHIGMTDLVKRPTTRASELSTDEHRAGVERLEQLCHWLRPGALAVVGLAGWRAAVDRRAAVGWQPGTLGTTPVYVLPSTSGLNAGTSLAELTAHLRTAAEAAPTAPIDPAT